MRIAHELTVTTLAATSAKGRRFKASFNGRSLTTAYDYALNALENASQAAYQLASESGVAVISVAKSQKGWTFHVE